jgi:hypothetical protein
VETYGCRAVILFVIYPPINVGAGVQFHANPCGIRGCQSGAGTGLSPSTLVFVCQYHPINAPYSFIRVTDSA